jgi:hypothetical protein
MVDELQEKQPPPLPFSDALKQEQQDFSLKELMIA